MKKMVIVSAALVAVCSALIVAIRVYISRRELDRYYKTIETLNDLTMGSESNLTNVHHDAWGHAMHINKDTDCWTVVSLGHDPTDASDDVVMKWNPKFGQINIDFEYDGQIRSYSRNEERDN